MSADPADEASARALNAELARNYDELVYEPAAFDEVDPERVLGLAALFGREPPSGAPIDMLDLGCGVGSMLRRFGPRTGGRLVGMDISQAEIALARAALADFGARAEIFAADLLDVDPDALGQFDLIYCIGVIYVTPPAVRRRILEIVGRCLRPGGVALVTYYAGGVPLLQANVGRVVRLAVGAQPGTAARIAAGRAVVEQLKAQIPGDDPWARVMREVCKVIEAKTDANFLHEVLTPMTPLETSAITATLAEADVRFLGYLNRPVPRLATSRERALAAEVLDFTMGGYRHGVFVKSAAECAPAPLPESAAQWRCPASPDAGSPSSGRPFTLVQANGASVQLTHPAMQAAAHALIADGPLTFAQVRDRARSALLAAGTPAPDDSLAILERDFESLWRHGFMTPSYRLGG